ncbi:hypothetical protein SBBP2_2180013 [Burkholderiales bacterium]|nr:hypothetical protein SBBP2_2180013 [Burkholderiales bacterium]
MHRGQEAREWKDGTRSRPISEGLRPLVQQWTIFEQIPHEDAKPLSNRRRSKKCDSPRMHCEEALLKLEPNQKIKLVMTGAIALSLSLSLSLSGREVACQESTST